MVPAVTASESTVVMDERKIGPGGNRSLFDLESKKTSLLHAVQKDYSLFAKIHRAQQLRFGSRPMQTRANYIVLANQKDLWIHEEILGEFSSSR